MFNAGSYMITIAELPNFVEEAEGVFTEDEYEELIMFLADHPDAGDVIPGTGGIRKLRWAAGGRGKRGGARVIYYFRDLNIPVYLLAVYKKGEKIDLTAAEKGRMSQMIELISREAIAKRFRIVKRG